MTTAEKLYAEALALDKEGNYEKALTMYTAAAELGYVPAQLSTGVAHLCARGTAQDYKSAVYWLSYAAEQNNASAISNLAYCYLNGYGVEKDEQKAAELYKKASNLGDSFASAQYEKLSKKFADEKSKVDVNDFINQMFNTDNQKIATVEIRVKLKGEKTAYTPCSVYVPEFDKTMHFRIPNSTLAGQTLMVSAGINSALNGVNKPLKLVVTKVTYEDDPAAQMPKQKININNAQSYIDIRKKAKEIKRRIYLKPSISLFFGIYFIFSFASLLLMMFMYPEGGAPELLMNISGIGFSIGFIPVFWFKFLPYIVSRYPDPGFFKTVKIMKHLKERNLFEKAVREMETCKLVPFGDKMCLSDSFLFPKKKDGVIIPCDELLWVYVSYSKRRGYGYIMLGTKHTGLECFSRIRRSKQYEQIVAETVNELKKRNPSIMVGETRENRKKYFQIIKNK